MHWIVEFYEGGYARRHVRRRIGPFTTMREAGAYGRANCGADEAFIEALIVEPETMARLVTRGFAPQFPTQEKRI
jgi:hypothetical protein